MSLTPEQFEKLPAAVREHIEELDRRLQEADEKLARLYDDDHTDGDRVIGLNYGADNQGPFVKLPVEDIRFRLGRQPIDSNYIDASLTRSPSGLFLSLHSADGGLRVLPRVSNEVWVEVDRG